MRSIRCVWREEDGQDLIEYALLASFIAMVVVAALRFLGPKIAVYYDRINANF